MYCKNLIKVTEIVTHVKNMKKSYGITPHYLLFIYNLIATFYSFLYRIYKTVVRLCLLRCLLYIFLLHLLWSSLDLIHTNSLSIIQAYSLPELAGFSVSMELPTRQWKYLVWWPNSSFLVLVDLQALYLDSLSPYISPDASSLIKAIQPSWPGWCDIDDHWKSITYLRYHLGNTALYF